MHCPSLYSSRELHHQRAQTLQDFSNVGLDHPCMCLKKKGISQDIILRLVGDVEPSTIEKYQCYWSRFADWCNGRQVNCGNLSVNSLCKYLVVVFDEGLSASTLKFVRSALAFFLSESHREIVEHRIVSRLLKSFEKLRPTIPRYVVTWDFNIVLLFLRSWHPIARLTLKQLTLKTCMLIALASSDRAQTIQCIRFDVL